MKEWIVPDDDIGVDGAYFDYKELIRCKECKHYWESARICVYADFPVSNNTKPDDYCSRAEKEEE